jgi:hypothetical protein
MQLVGQCMLGNCCLPVGERKKKKGLVQHLPALLQPLVSYLADELGYSLEYPFVFDEAAPSTH